MDITATAPTPTATPAPTAAAEPKGALSSDFETFLTMLTVQMQNQDPLNPVKSEDFAVQLATFSGVEQQVRTNDLLESLSAAMGASGLSGLAGWVGMEVRAPVAAQFDGAPIDLSFDPMPTATSRFLVVTNADGATVQRLAIVPGETELTWAGVSDAGSPMPDGPYSFAIEAYDGETLTTSTQVPVYTRVAEARIENGATVLVTETGATVAVADVTALREPS